MEPTLEPVTEEPKITETVTPTKIPLGAGGPVATEGRRERSEAQKLALSKAREKAMEVRSANADLRKKQKAIDAAAKERSKKEVEEKFDALQKPSEVPQTEAEEVEEEEVVYEPKPKKKVKRRVVVVQPESSSEEEEVTVHKQVMKLLDDFDKINKLDESKTNHHDKIKFKRGDYRNEFKQVAIRR